MSSTQVVPNVPDATPGLSEPERLINTFVAPTKTFADIRRNASWWVPFLITAVFSYLFVFAVDRKIGFDRIAQNAIAQNPKAQQRLEQASPEQREQAITMQAKITKSIFYAVPVLSIIFALIIAGVLLATFNFGFGAEVPFSKAMAIVVYGGLPMIVQSILTAITIFAGSDPDGFNPQNPVATNPAYLMNPVTTNKFIYSAVSCFDVIALWMIFLMAIGFSENSKVKRGTAFITILAWYLFWKLGTGALGAAFS